MLSLIAPNAPIIATRPMIIGFAVTTLLIVAIANVAAIAAWPKSVFIRSTIDFIPAPIVPVI
jgi:hypothetical protein